MSKGQETDIRLYGFEELYEKLEIMPNKVNSVVDKALKQCAKPVQEEAKRRARKSKTPGGTSGHGHMADHIEISDVEQKGTEKRVIVGFTKGDNSPFYYAKFIEWGASSGPWSSSHYGKKPFMRPAYKAKVMESLEIFKNLVGKEITK